MGLVVGESLHTLLLGKRVSIWWCVCVCVCVCVPAGVLVGVAVAIMLVHMASTVGEFDKKSAKFGQGLKFLLRKS